MSSNRHRSKEQTSKPRFLRAPRAHFVPPLHPKPHRFRGPQPIIEKHLHSFNPAEIFFKSEIPYHLIQLHILLERRMASRHHIACILGLIDGNVRRGHVLIGFDVEQVNHNFSKVLAQGDFLDCGLCFLYTNHITMTPTLSNEYFEHLYSLLHTTYLRDANPQKLANRNIDWKLTEQGVRQPGPLARYPRMAPNTGTAEPNWSGGIFPLPALQQLVRAAIPMAPTTTLIVHDTNLETRLMAAWGHIGPYIWYDTQLGDHEEFGRGRRKLKVLCETYGVPADEWDFHNSGYDATFTMHVALCQAFRGAGTYFVRLAAAEMMARPVVPFQGTVYYSAAANAEAREKKKKSAADTAVEDVVKTVVEAVVGEEVDPEEVEQI